MKKLFTLAIAAGMFSIVSCGPSAEQKAAEEQRIADSTAAAESAMKAAEEAAAAASMMDTSANKADSNMMADTVKSKTGESMEKQKNTGEKMVDKSKGK